MSAVIMMRKLNSSWKKYRKLKVKAEMKKSEGKTLIARSYGSEEGYDLLVEGKRILLEGYRCYRSAVDEVYGPRSTIDWTTGRVLGPDHSCIPFSEFGIEEEN